MRAAVSPKRPCSALRACARPRGRLQFERRDYLPDLARPLHLCGTPARLLVSESSPHERNPVYLVCPSSGIGPCESAANPRSAGAQGTPEVPRQPKGPPRDLRLRGAVTSRVNPRAFGVRQQRNRRGWYTGGTSRFPIVGTTIANERRCRGCQDGHGEVLQTTAVSTRSRGEACSRNPRRADHSSSQFVVAAPVSVHFPMLLPEIASAHVNVAGGSAQLHATGPGLHCTLALSFR